MIFRFLGEGAPCVLLLFLLLGEGVPCVHRVLIQVLYHFFGGRNANGQQVDKTSGDGLLSVQLREIAGAGMVNW